VVEQSTRIYRGMCYGCVERDESEVGGRIYPSFEVVAATHHRFDTPRRLRPFAMVPPPAPHNSGTAGVPARATVPMEPPHSTCPARAGGPRPHITKIDLEHHFTKLRQEALEWFKFCWTRRQLGPPEVSGLVAERAVRSDPVRVPLSSASGNTYLICNPPNHPPSAGTMRI